MPRSVAATVAPAQLHAFAGCWSPATPVDGVTAFAIEPDSTLSAGTLRDRPNGARLGSWTLEEGQGLRIRLGREGREWLATAGVAAELQLRGPDGRSVTARRVDCPR